MLPYGHIVKMRAVGASEMSVESYGSPHCHVPEDSITHDDCNENIKTHVFFAPCNIKLNI